MSRGNFGDWVNQKISDYRQFEVKEELSSECPICGRIGTVKVGSMSGLFSCDECGWFWGKGNPEVRDIEHVKTNKFILFLIFLFCFMLGGISILTMLIYF